MRDVDVWEFLGYPKEEPPCQWREGDTCIANLGGLAANAVPAYVLNVRVRDRVLDIMYADGCKISVLMEWAWRESR